MDITFWHWLGLTMLLLFVELLSGSGYLLCIALASAMMAIAFFVFPEIHWAVGSTVFALLAISTALIWRRWLSHHPIKSDAPLLNQRGKQYIGRKFTLSAPIHDNYGTLHIDDSQWKIYCDTNLPAGSKVEVVDIDNVILTVKPIH